jgi:hypothetical protein
MTTVSTARALVIGEQAVLKFNLSVDIDTTSWTTGCRVVRKDATNKPLEVRN